MAEDVRRLQEENQALRQRIHLLEQKIDLLVRQIYGPKSEKLDPGQLELLFNPDGSKKDEAPTAIDLEGLLAGADPRKTKRRSSYEAKPRIPDDLPVVEEVIDPPAVRACLAHGRPRGGGGGGA